MSSSLDFVAMAPPHLVENSFVRSLGSKNGGAHGTPTRSLIRDFTFNVVSTPENWAFRLVSNSFNARTQ